MKQLIVIGNLGSDAEVRKEGGREYITMSIADTTSTQGADGKRIEKTEWISASWNGCHDGVLPYLKKGAKVYAFGDCCTRLFSSAKDRCMKAGINLYIRSLELVSTNVDEVPRFLYDDNGVEHAVSKYYFAGEGITSPLFDRRGQPFSVTPQGWVTPLDAVPQSDQEPIDFDAISVGQGEQS
mgnify:CR=1 FL=1